MEVIVSGKHIEITPAIRQYATDHTARLPRYLDTLRQLEVITDKGEGHGFEVELKAHVEHSEILVAKVKGMDLYACIDQAIEKMERQLRDHKEILKQKKGRTSMSG